MAPDPLGWPRDTSVELPRDACVSKGWEPAGSTWVQLEWLGRSKTPHRHTFETHKRRTLKEAKGLVAVASQGVPVFMPS